MIPLVANEREGGARQISSVKLTVLILESENFVLLGHMNGNPVARRTSVP